MIRINTNDMKIKGIYDLTLAKGRPFGKLRASGFGNFWFLICCYLSNQKFLRVNPGSRLAGRDDRK
jgi:hypothetical protein